MDKLTKLSEAIRYGSTFIKEGELFGVRRNGECGCCPVGTAYLAAQLLIADELSFSGWDLLTGLSERFNVPLAIVAEVSNRHFTKLMTRAQCADWLEAQGY